MANFPVVQNRGSLVNFAGAAQAKQATLETFRSIGDTAMQISALQAEKRVKAAQARMFNVQAKALENQVRQQEEAIAFRDTYNSAIQKAFRAKDFDSIQNLSDLVGEQGNPTIDEIYNSQFENFFEREMTFNGETRAMQEWMAMHNAGQLDFSFGRDSRPPTVEEETAVRLGRTLREHRILTDSLISQAKAATTAADLKTFSGRIILQVAQESRAIRESRRPIEEEIQILEEIEKDAGRLGFLGIPRLVGRIGSLALGRLESEGFLDEEDVDREASAKTLIRRIKKELREELAALEFRQKILDEEKDAAIEAQTTPVPVRRFETRRVIEGLPQTRQPETRQPETRQPASPRATTRGNAAQDKDIHSIFAE